MKTLQEIKGEYAAEKGYGGWSSFENDLRFFASNKYPDAFDEIAEHGCRCRYYVYDCMLSNNQII